MKRSNPSEMILDRADFVTCNEAARVTPFSRTTWALWAQKGVVSYLRIGKTILIPRSEIARVIIQGTKPATEQVAARG